MYKGGLTRGLRMEATSQGVLGVAITNSEVRVTGASWLSSKQSAKIADLSQLVCQPVPYLDMLQ